MQKNNQLREKFDEIMATLTPGKKKWLQFADEKKLDSARRFFYREKNKYETSMQKYVPLIIKTDMKLKQLCFEMEESGRAGILKEWDEDEKGNVIQETDYTSPGEKTDNEITSENESESESENEEFKQWKASRGD